MSILSHLFAFNADKIEKRLENIAANAQRDMEAGFFEIKEILIGTAAHGFKTKSTTRVTGKGRIHIITRLCKEHGIPLPQLPLAFTNSGAAE